MLKSSTLEFQMLFQDIQPRAMPMVDVGGDEAGGVEGEIAPAADGDRGFPG